MRPDTHIKPCSHLWQEWKYAVGSENPGGTIKDAVKKRYLETLVQNGYEQWRQFQVKGIVVPMCEELGKKKKKNSRKCMNTWTTKVFALNNNPILLYTWDLGTIRSLALTFRLTICDPHLTWRPEYSQKHSVLLHTISTTPYPWSFLIWKIPQMPEHFLIVLTTSKI